MEFLTDEQSGWPVGGICHLGNNQVNEALGLDLTRYGAFIWGQWTPCCPFWTLKFTQVISQGQTEAWLRYCLLTPFLLSSNSLLNPLSPPLTHHSLSVFPLSSNLMHHLPCLVFSFIFSYLSPLQQESALEADSLISPLSPCFWIHLPFPQVAAPALLPRWRTRRVDEAGQGKKKKSGGIIQAWGMRLWTLKGPHGSDSSWKKSLLSSGKKLLMAISAPRSDLYWLAVYISNKWAFNCRVGFLYCYPDGGCKSLLLLLSL